MGRDLIDKIYETAFVPELWPGVLGELAQIAEGRSTTLFVTKPDVPNYVEHYATSSSNPEAVERFAKEGWFWRGQFAARFFGARHAGF